MTTSLLPLIYAKRHGGELSKEDINFWIKSLTSKKPPPLYQTSALLAFIFNQGMTDEETEYLTTAIRFSGVQFKYPQSSQHGFFIDKHSTGGIGDKITIPLLPLALACDDRFFYPTIAGRGLGHTGGTVDKLQSIPGMRCDLPMSYFYKVLKKHRGSFLGQSSQIAPADRVLYSLRDVTGTVESIPLITASILGKKLTESLNYLILDLKCGNGAFLHNPAHSQALAESIVRVSQLAGLKANVVMTAMDRPLGRWSGNFCEVQESLDILKGNGPHDSTALTYEFTTLFLAQLGYSKSAAKEKIISAISSGRALELFYKIIESQGARIKAFEKKLQSPRLKSVTVKAERSGYLSFQTKRIGLALVELGGGRKTLEDKIDEDVSIEQIAKTGNVLKAEDPVFKVYYRDSSRLKKALAQLSQAIHIKDAPPELLPLVIRQL